VGFMARKIEILGLGAGDIDQLPLGIYRKLKNADHIYLRTKEHPVVSQLEDEGVQYESFDHIYERHEQFESVYKEIVDALFSAAKDQDIVYAVPGHPLVAEKTVQLLLESSKEKGYDVTVEGGQSFLDAMFTSLKIDPVDGFQMLDGATLHRDELQLNHHIIICQVYDQMVASHVKLTLMEHLPDDYRIFIVTAAGSKEEEIKEIPLFELDRQTTISNLTSVYVPPVSNEALLYHQFATLRRVIAELRGPNGCPWDKKQTHVSLKKYMLEEAYELLEAIDLEDDDHMIEELGDVLLQVMLHAQIGEDEGMFSIDDVIRGITEKMIRRHPHVFGDVSVKDAEDVVKNWEQIKKEEKAANEDSLLNDVAKSLPGILKAYKYQKKAATVGFDWPDVKPMWEKIHEEIREFQQETEKNEQDRQKMIEEFGDILFALVNVARFYKIDPEEAISVTNVKFYQRFRYMEEAVKKEGKTMNDLSLDELDEYWNKAKEVGL
jgi:tetrapyrrole methylase family protein / MazG family protein